MIGNSKTKRPLLVSCQVFEREIEDCLSRSEIVVDVYYLPLGIHGDTSENARAAIQAEIDRADAEVHNVVLVAYGLCNYGVRGLVAGELSLVIPRHYDCISLLLGSRARYVQLLNEQPSTYFKTPGWVDAAADGSIAPLGSVASRLGIGQDLETLVAKYGEDNGQYLYETLSHRMYSRHLYVSSCISGESEVLCRCRQQAWKAGCPLEIAEGSTRCLESLLLGPWEEQDFLIVPPGKQVDLSMDDRLLCWKEQAL